MSHRLADSLLAGSGQNWFDSLVIRMELFSVSNQFHPDPARKVSAKPV